MNLKIIFAVVALSHESGCSNDPIGKPFEVQNEIKEISFKAAHQYDDCGAKRGCRAVFVPDTWFILFCSTERANNCFTRSITHAPWKWQTPGTRVVVTWQRRERFNTMESIRLNGTMEDVQL